MPTEHESLADRPTQDVERILRLRAEVRRARGEYPPNLDADVVELIDRTIRGAQSRGSGVDDATLELLHSGDVGVVVEALARRIAELERDAFDVRAVVGRVERLEAGERAREFRPWYSSEAFEARFRGERAPLLARLDDLADEFAGAPGPVFDMGCGRGELLELLGRRGIDCHGVDLHGPSVAAARDRLLSAEVGDGLAHLEALSPQSLGGVALIQVIEHLTAQQQIDVVAAAARALRPGGRLVIETVNPLSLYVYAHALYVDPTHTRPVHPLYLHFVAEQAGFGDLRLDWRSPVPTDERLPYDAFGPHADHNIITRLNDVLYGMQDYALIATRP